MKKLLIKQVRIINPAANTDRTGDVLIENGRIAKIGSVPDAGGAETAEGEGLWLFPGLVDIHAHFREPGGEGKETIDSGSRAAAAGGVTSVVCMANTNPPIDNRTGVEFILERVKQSGKARVYPAGTLTKGRAGLELAPIGEMIEAGAVAITDDGSGIMDSQVMRRAMEYATIFNVPILSHSEDHALTAGGCCNEGSMSMKLGVVGCPPEAETIQVARDLILAQKTGAHVHIQHVSAAGSVDLIRFYKAKGVRVTAEASPHHLLLTEDAVEGYNADAKMNPPLRCAEDRAALFEGLRDGTIDCIATDHAPHTPSEKSRSFPEAPFGILGLETLLPLTLGPIREKLGWDAPRVLRLVTDIPARVMRLPGGVLEEGAPADLALWDPGAQYTFDKNASQSKSRNTPFHGWPMKGRVVRTILGGETVYPFGG